MLVDMANGVDPNHVRLKDKEGYRVWLCVICLNHNGVAGPKQRHMDVRHVGAMIT